jgi:hypothetical protein
MPSQPHVQQIALDGTVTAGSPICDHSQVIDTAEGTDVATRLIAGIAELLLPANGPLR